MKPLFNGQHADSPLPHKSLRKIARTWFEMENDKDVTKKSVTHEATRHEIINMVYCRLLELGYKILPPDPNYVPLEDD